MAELFKRNLMFKIFFKDTQEFLCKYKARNPYSRGRLSTDDLLVLTKFRSAAFDNANIIYFFCKAKQATIMRRSTVLRISRRSSAKLHLHWHLYGITPATATLDSDMIISILCCAAKGGQGK